MNDHTKKTEKKLMPTLKPKLYQDDEFFIADEIEINSLRSDSASLEHPFFALKAGDTKTRTYQNGDVVIEVIPSSLGLATIFDKDIWIYAISKMQQAINQGQEIDRVIYFTAYDFLKTTNRANGGRAYKEIEKSLIKLRATTIATTIDFNEKQVVAGVGLIDSFGFIKEKKGRLDIGMIKLTLPEWLFNAIEKKQVLKISSDYFRIRKAIDRRVYEIARKHCGYQSQFTIALDKLYLKSGSSSALKEFKRAIKELAEKNDLPDYEIFLEVKKNMVTFKNRQKIKLIESNKQEIENDKAVIEHKKIDLTEHKNYKFYEKGKAILCAHQNKKINMSKWEFNFLSSLKKDFEKNPDFELSEKQKAFFLDVLEQYNEVIEILKSNECKASAKQEKSNACVIELNSVLVGVETGNQYIVNEHGFIFGAQYQNFGKDGLSAGVNHIEQLKELVLAKKLEIKS